MSDLSIYSSEKVYYKYEIVGLGSRFVGFLLDYLIIMAVYAVLAFFAFLTVPKIGLSENVMIYVYVGILVFAFFLTLIYFIFFETTWNGQTPGKKAAGIRVIRSTGEAVTVGSILVRNILRFVDFLPASYTVGILTILFSKNRQRVGDMVAGTVVVKEQHLEVPETFTAVEIDPMLAGLLRLRMPLLLEEDFNIVRNYFTRQATLTPGSSAKLADNISQKLAVKMGIDVQEIGEPTSFLKAVLVNIDKTQSNTL